jgi:hypothetical protein
MWAGETLGDKGLDYDLWVISNHDQIRDLEKNLNPDFDNEFFDEEALVIGSLHNLNESRYWKKVLKESTNPAIYNECLKHVDDRFCFIILVKLFRFDLTQTLPGKKAEAIINKIRIRKYILAALKAIDVVYEYCIAEDLAVFQLKEILRDRLAIMSNSSDFILD